MRKTNEKIIDVKGITLIALVITIIVLLILAGVSIAMLTGENGILNQAAKAKNETEKAQANEALILDEYNKFLNNAIGETESTTQPEEPAKEVTASDIADDKDVIGKDIEGYEAEGVTDWKIFYAGTMPGETEPHIYLISSDYIPYEVIPNSTAGNKPDKGDSSYPRAAYFTSILNDYEGSASITDSRIKGLNNSYFNDNSFTSTNNNMKSVAYMLDTKAWSGFATEKADYAIGGPTVELLFKSYNQKYGTNYIAEAISNTGYHISKDGGSSWNDEDEYMFSISDRTYVISETSNANAMWIASPCEKDNETLMRIEYYGAIYTAYYNKTYLGFRPLVCLKSDVKLEENGSGYTIK